MSILNNKAQQILAETVWFTKDKLYVKLNDNREIGVPLNWFPSLANSTKKQRENWRLIGKGMGIHWADLDEDISVAGLLKA